ncbi:MAG: hypothetical protein AAF387_12540 [Pseudomonadota bacterium]
MNHLRSKVLYPLLALFLGVSPQIFANASAATVLLYDFDNASGSIDLSPEVVATGLNPQAWTVVSSTLRDFSGNPGKAIATSSFNNGNRFELTVLVAAGQIFELSGFAFDQLASGSGPSEWFLSIDDEVIATGNTTSSFENVLGATPRSLVGTFTVGLGGTNAGSNLGTLRIDNFALEGSVQPVPLPASILLLFSACAGLLASRRSRHD